MTKSHSSYIIYSTKQLAALTSSARQEILDVLAQMGTVSVANLAATLGKPADALYYHIRILKRAGLVVGSSVHTPDGRSEARFSAVAKDVRIDYESARRLDDKLLTNAVGSMLRLGIRDFRRALNNKNVVVSGKQRELWAMRKTGWIAGHDLTRILKSIERLGSMVAKPSSEGQLYGITILFTPLNRRRAK